MTGKTTSEVGPSGELRPPWRERKGGECERKGGVDLESGNDGAGCDLMLVDDDYG